MCFFYREINYVSTKESFLITWEFVLNQKYVQRIKFREYLPLDATFCCHIGVSNSKETKRIRKLQHIYFTNILIELKRDAFSVNKMVKQAKQLCA